VGKTDPTGHDGSWWQTALTITAIAVVVAVVVIVAVVAVVAAPVVIAAAATAVGVAAGTEAENVLATAAETGSTAVETAATTAETASTAADTAATDVASEGNTNPTVTYSRVQGGTPPNASRLRNFLNEDSGISIPNKSANLCVSVGCDHAEYFQGIRGGGSQIVQFDVPKWFDDLVNENIVDQYGYRSNPLNQGGTVPKLVDPTTPGVSYEFPLTWIRWNEEYATNCRVIW